MGIPWRSTVLFVVAVAGILFAVATRSLVVLQALTMLAFAILGVLAVVLVRRGARSIPSDPRLARVAERLRESTREGARGRPRGAIRAMRSVPAGGERTASVPGARGPRRGIAQPSNAFL